MLVLFKAAFFVWVFGGAALIAALYIAFALTLISAAIKRVCR